MYFLNKRSPFHFKIGRILCFTSQMKLVFESCFLYNWYFLPLLLPRTIENLISSKILICYKTVSSMIVLISHKEEGKLYFFANVHVVKFQFYYPYGDISRFPLCFFLPYLYQVSWVWPGQG